MYQNVEKTICFILLILNHNFTLFIFEINVGCSPCFSTPPSRTAAFEEFKAEKGSEINRVLIENKGQFEL